MDQRGKHRFRLSLFGFLSLGLMLIIFLLSAQPGPESTELSLHWLDSLPGRVLIRLFPGLDAVAAEHLLRKLAHMFEYCCLTLCYSLFFLELWGWRIPAAFPAALAGCFFYACTDEWHQTFVPGRSGSFQDVLIDTLGGIVALLLVCAPMLLKRGGRPRKKRM